MGRWPGGADNCPGLQAAATLRRCPHASHPVHPGESSCNRRRAAAVAGLRQRRGRRGRCLWRRHRGLAGEVGRRPAAGMGSGLPRGPRRPGPRRSQMDALEPGRPRGRLRRQSGRPSPRHRACLGAEGAQGRRGSGARLDQGRRPPARPRRLRPGRLDRGGRRSLARPALPLRFTGLRSYRGGRDPRPVVGGAGHSPRPLRSGARPVRGPIPPGTDFHEPAHSAGRRAWSRRHHH